MNPAAYEILELIRHKTPETFQHEGKTHNWYAVEFRPTGKIVIDSADAKKRFGVSYPVLRALA